MTPFSLPPFSLPFGRSRPMCEYPGWPRYRGTGDINDWTSYEIMK